MDANTLIKNAIEMIKETPEWSFALRAEKLFYLVEELGAPSEVVTGLAEAIIAEAQEQVEAVKELGGDDNAVEYNLNDGSVLQVAYLLDEDGQKVYSMGAV